MTVPHPPLERLGGSICVSPRWALKVIAVSLLAILFVLALSKTAWAQGAPSPAKGRALEDLTHHMLSLGERHRFGQALGALPAEDLLQVAAERRQLLSRGAGGGGGGRAGRQP